MTIDNIRTMTGIEKFVTEEQEGRSWNTGVSENSGSEFDSYSKYVLYDKEQRKVYLECLRTSSRETNVRILQDDEFIE